MHKRKRRTDDVPPERPAFAGTALWHEARRFVLSEIGSQNQSRFKLDHRAPQTLVARLLAFECKCAGCEQSHYPFRRAVGSEQVSLHVTGLRNGGHPRCSYGERASAQVHWLRIELGRSPRVPERPRPEPEPVLF